MNRRIYQSFAINTCVVAAAWVALFHLNHVLFSSFEITDQTNWIFLPAALRMLAVMLIGWAGVSGLFVGTLLTCNPVLGENLGLSLGLAVMSSLGPMLGVQLGMKFLNVPPDLAGLDAKKLIVFAVLGAMCTAAMHNLFFNLTELAADKHGGFIAMFVGDLVGTAIVLYLASFVLKRTRTPAA